jgi:hypothetical protein
MPRGVERRKMTEQTTSIFVAIFGLFRSIRLNGHHTKLENNDTGILHEADVG